MIKFETGNIVTGDYPVFCQQVNCKGVMGAGLAKQIRNKYPEVYTKYKNVCDKKEARLGKNVNVYTRDNRICVNMFAQYNYGRNSKQTNYEAFQSCLNQLKTGLMTYRSDKVVAFPYGIGCGLAGGDWKVIYPMIEDFSRMISQDVVIVG